jgi:hypothetical protein
VVVTRYIPIFVDFSSASKWPDEAVTSLLQGGPCLKKIEIFFSRVFFMASLIRKATGIQTFIKSIIFGLVYWYIYRNSGVVQFPKNKVYTTRVKKEGGGRDAPFPILTSRF